jgi:LysW-gamma-L-lysine carboxypeptidase
MRDNGYDEAFVDEAGNAIGIIGQGTRDIVLLGHIDTFGGSIPARIEGRCLFGRGAVDAKGPLCTFAVAATQATLSADTRLIVVGAVEEEASSSKGARHVLTQFNPSMCIIGEPSQWDRITLGYKGRLLLRWRWDGPLAHSASDVHSGPERAFIYWQQVCHTVDAINQDRSSLFDRLDATLQSINSGDDGVHGWTEMVLGFRLPPDIVPEQLPADIVLDDNGARIVAYGHERAHVAGKDTDLCRAFRAAIRAHGGRPRFVHKTGTSDMNVVAPVWNCPILAYGSGDSSLDHTPNEHIDLDEYQRAIAVLTDALSRL